MNFGTRPIDIDAWKGSGTVSGIHTHSAPVRIKKIQETGDLENTVELKNNEVVVAKDLRVEGQLITAGWPPPGGNMQLPEHANFKSLNVLGGNLKVLTGGALFVPGDANLGEVSATQVSADTLIGYNTQATFLDVDAIRAHTGSIVNFPDPVNMEGNLTAAKYLGTDVIVEGLVDGDVVIAQSFMKSHGILEGASVVANQSVSAPTITTNNISSTGTLNATGSWDFSTATVTGLSGGGGDTYPSIEEKQSYIEMTKPVHLAILQANVVHTDSLQSRSTGMITLHDTVDFSNATVTGLDMGGYPSITEESDRIVIEKNLDMGVSDVKVSFVGTDNAGIELEEGANRINFVINNHDMMWSLLRNSVDGTTTTLHYSQNTMMNNAQCHTISPRPGYNKVEFDGLMDFGDATVEGILPGLTSDTDSNRLVVEQGTSLYFADSMANPGIATEISETQIHTNYCGGLNNGWRFTTFSENAPLMKAVQGGKDILYISEVQMISTVPFTTEKKGSGGNFTHCHLTEGAQEETWEVGRVVTSTGEFCARNQDGSIITSPSAAPDGSHAMCKVQYSGAGDAPLGVIASVETVADNEILHEHGGITLKANILEPDGHKMVRVAASGDVLAWVVQPTFDEINVPPMSGLWNKCVGDGYGNHNILSTHVGVEAEGHLAVDNQIIDTATATVAVTAAEITVIPAAPTLTPALFSGLYTKTINGIEQNEKVIMVCNEDLSFLLTEHLDGLENRVAAVEATLAELLGPD